MYENFNKSMNTLHITCTNHILIQLLGEKSKGEKDYQAIVQRLHHILLSKLFLSTNGYSKN